MNDDDDDDNDDNGCCYMLQKQMRPEMESTAARTQVKVFVDEAIAVEAEVVVAAGTGIAA